MLRSCPQVLRPLAVSSLLIAGCKMLSGVPGPGAPDTGPPTAVALKTDATRPAAARTLAVELLFIRHDPRDPVLRDDLWSVIDEQSCGADLRHRLHANGLRAGIVSGPLPTHVAARFAAGWAVDDVPTVAAEAADAVFVRRSLQLLPGRRSEVVTTPALAELVVLEDRDGEITGSTFGDATVLAVLHAWPDADGRMRLEFEPEIRHGPLRRSWVGEDGMFRFETGQTRHRLAHLRLEASLPPGSMLVIGETEATSAGIGAALLRDRTAGESVGSRLLVIRPSAAVVDPMFAGGDAPHASGSPTLAVDR